MVRMFELVDDATKNQLRELMQAKFLVRSYQTRKAEKQARKEREKAYIPKEERGSH